ncbi:CopD family protein [Sphingomonas sabuli]|uniref:Protoporphyrinogen IX oxidase n=1 Tax=Sphingomonas sabuli TaxID=2764186 RepID=A0A7G9L0F1_9SPHN|nr:CopD family protein [Sphingomonas sabuli]QNM82100.1 CopD family protein [Sphingomonas sabuli]
MNEMSGFLGAAYPWVKAAHVTFVIYWIAGLLLLPRFYVYHHETSAGSAEDRAWIERERRTRTIILSPALIAVWLLGLLLALNVGAFSEGWFHAKLALVIGLSAYQGWLGSYGKQLAAGKRSASDKTLRMMNEIPGIVAALVVVLVIVRPF